MKSTTPTLDEVQKNYGTTGKDMQGAIASMTPLINENNTPVEVVLTAMNDVIARIELAMATVRASENGTDTQKLLNVLLNIKKSVDTAKSTI